MECLLKQCVLEHKEEDEEIESVEHPAKTARGDGVALVGRERLEQPKHVYMDQ